MADGEVFRRSRLDATIFGLSGLTLTAFCAGAAVVFTVDRRFGSILVLVLLPFVVAWIYTVAFGWWTLRVDSLGLHYAGLLGRRALLRWAEIEQLGSVRWPMPALRWAIVARPVDQANRPIRTVGRKVGLPGWRNIAVPDQWRKSKHGGTLDDAVRRYAGVKWVGQIRRSGA